MPNSALALLVSTMKVRKGDAHTHTHTHNNNTTTHTQTHNTRTHPQHQRLARAACWCPHNPSGGCLAPVKGKISSSRIKKRVRVMTQHDAVMHVGDWQDEAAMWETEGEDEDEEEDACPNAVRRKEKLASQAAAKHAARREAAALAAAAAAAADEDDLPDPSHADLAAAQLARSSPLPGWLQPFTSALEAQIDDQAAAVARGEQVAQPKGDGICFESVSIPTISVRKYIIVLYSHFRDLATWASCMALIRRADTSGIIPVTPFTVHRVLLTALAIGLVKSLPGRDISMAAGPGGVDDEDLASMVRAFVKIVDYKKACRVEAMQEALASGSPQRTRALDFACALVATTARGGGPGCGGDDDGSGGRSGSGNGADDHDLVRRRDPVREWVYSCSPATSHYDVPVTDPEVSENPASPRGNYSPFNSTGSSITRKFKTLRSSFRNILLKRTQSASTMENKDKDQSPRHSPRQSPMQSPRS
eukprot:Rhum_TRINITY_DN14601_c13_g9::Rhum_TRINITY_DN14601_c13_g9_i1::g.104882::m.104882